MTEPVIFAVERHAGREIPAVYRGSLPLRLTRKIPRLPDGTPAEPGLLVYAVRLDKLPNRRKSATLAELFAQFLHMRKMGTLPAPNLVDPPMKGEGRKGTLRGEAWKPPARTWTERPADPYPDPDAIVPKRGAYRGIS